MYEIEEEADKTSKFNSAQAELQRIDSLWQKVHTAAQLSRFLTWNALLDRIWSELSGDLKEGAEEEHNFYRLTENLSRNGRLSDGETLGFKSPYQKDKDTVMKQKEWLMKKEIFLRRLQNKVGKGTAYIDEFQDNIE